MTLRTCVLAFSFLVGLGGLLFSPRFAFADPGKNLKVLPSSTDTKEVKKLMKLQAKALGVQCDFCHDTEDFAKDDKSHKGIARKMMKMVKEINAKNFGGKNVVGCVTCHNGKKEPAKGD